MGQLIRKWVLNTLLPLLAAVFTCGCDHPRPVIPATQPGNRTIASLVPAATDMLLDMGLQDRLVGISNYDSPRAMRLGIVKVGDYHTVDWEILTVIRPAYLIIPRQKEEITPVFRNRAKELGITLVETHSDRLNEVYTIMEALGGAIEEKQKAEQMVLSMRHDLTNIQMDVAGKPAIRTLIVLDDKAQFVVGPRNFLDDILTTVGGTNVACNLGKDYPKIDAEKLLQLDPDVIIQLMPDAPAQVIASAKSFWQTVPQLKAVQNGRVYTHTEWFLLLPSARMVDVARLMAQDLHPLTDSPQPATTVTK